MNVLVTGASGFLGKNFLIRSTPTWTGFATYHRSKYFQEFVTRLVPAPIKAFKVDLTSQEEIEALKQACPHFDACVFFAANGDPAVSTQRPVFDLQSNTVTLTQLLEKISFDRFIYFSSGAVYDGLSGAVNPLMPVHPTLPYAISKLASEQYLKHFKKQGQIKRWLALRFFGAFGPHEPERKIYTRLARQFGIEKNPVFTLKGDGKNLIDAMVVEDTIRALHLLLDGNVWNQTLDLYSGEPLTLKQLVERAGACFGLSPQIQYEGAVPEYISFHSNDSCMFQQFQFKPQISLEQGLQKLFRHLQTQGARSE